MPHYWKADIPYESICGVYANRPQQGLVTIAVDQQIVRWLNVRFLTPSTSASEFAEALNSRIDASLNDSNVVDRRIASTLAEQQIRNPWFSFFAAFTVLALHILAWASGSRFDGLDFVSSGAAFNPIRLTRRY